MPECRRSRAMLFVAASGVLASCGGASALIRQDDRVYEHASARLERTHAEVESSGAPPVEKAMFLQAEGFYRYRFEPPGRRGLPFLAEAAAAITDFPALQSLAGSLDLLDLRVRSVDAAVQLWETFNQRYPRSLLRPFALYRLGWAYRSVGAAGLPRASGNEAFDELVHLNPVSDLAGLIPAARAVPWKSKGIAATWSLVPGLGQMYVSERGSGIARLAIALAAAAAIVTPVVIGLHRSSGLTFRHDWPLLALGLGGLVVLSIDYTDSYRDAMRGVIQWNERAEAAFEDTHPLAP